MKYIGKYLSGEIPLTRECMYIVLEKKNHLAAKWTKKSLQRLSFLPVYKTYTNNFFIF
jgi:hypothetical protein